MSFCISFVLLDVLYKFTHIFHITKHHHTSVILEFNPSMVNIVLKRPNIRDMYLSRLFYYV